MWLLLGGLATLGVLLATRHSPRESPPRLTYNVHGYWAARGYVVDSSFTEEGTARLYAAQELAKHPDMRIAVIAMIDGRPGTILLAHPPNYDPRKAP
jgi:hypothetical protein